MALFGDASSLYINGAPAVAAYLDGVEIWSATPPEPVVGTTFSQLFTQGQAPSTTVETAWNTFRASLTGTYTSFTWSSTNGNSITATHPTNVQTLANA
jgi:hypothetical protein